MSLYGVLMEAGDEVAPIVHAVYGALAVAVLAYSSSASVARARAAASMAESAQRFVRSPTPKTHWLSTS